MTLPSLRATTDKPASLEVDLLVVGLRSGADGPQIFAPGFNSEIEELLLQSALSIGAEGDKNSTWRIPAPAGFSCQSVLFTGLGSGAPGATALREAAGYAALHTGSAARVGYALGSSEPGHAGAIAEGAMMGGHRITKAHRTPEPKLTEVVICGALDSEELHRALTHAQAVWRVRDLVASPPNVLTPETFVAQVSEMAASLNVSVEVFDEVRLAAEGYGGLTAVGQGSINPPRMMVLRWSPPKPTRHIALVGKGITFDSGGLSLKPANSMVGMKYDMTGAAVVSAVALASAELNVGAAVTAWVCLAENMPSGSASRPNDVISIKNGTTVEILNTDAEGRLVLADGLSAASAEAPDLMIDVATLTGAARVALGERYAGLMGTPEAVAAVEESAAQAGELVWPMPLPEELRALLSTDVADIANAKPGNTLGGMLLAGLFLQEFVGKTPEGTLLPWAHLDIAGPAENSSGPWGYTPKGPTGALTRTLLTIVSAPGPQSK
jgi:leucyl aminopeptidase